MQCSTLRANQASEAMKLVRINTLLFIYNSCLSIHPIETAKRLYPDSILEGELRSNHGLASTSDGRIFLFGGIGENGQA